MYLQSDEERQQIAKRLSRIEGQVRGVKRMIEDDRDCREVVQQLAAVRSAVHQTGLTVMRAYAAQCLTDPESTASEEEVLDYLVGTLGKWS